MSTIFRSRNKVPKSVTILTIGSVTSTQVANTYSVAIGMHLALTKVLNVSKMSTVAAVKTSTVSTSRLRERQPREGVLIPIEAHDRTPSPELYFTRWAKSVSCRDGEHLLHLIR